MPEFLGEHHGDVDEFLGNELSQPAEHSFSDRVRVHRVEPVARGCDDELGHRP